MLTRLAWLALEVQSLERARSFYAEHLDMPILAATQRERRFAAGETTLVCRRPTGIPRGGLHTHFAFAIPADEYDDWWDELAADHDLVQAQFGDVRSLYLDDPDGHCVELGQRPVDGPGIDGIFEVVLEVASLDRAIAFYERLGFERVDTGASRRRVRLAGPMALELWEPHLGIADARGGVHVDLGFETTDPRGALEAVADEVTQVNRVTDEAVVVRDPDGHVLTFLTGGA